MNAFIENQRVNKAIQRINDFKNASRLNVSDIVDSNGLQYVDFVMEGGGVLGIALLGYAYGLEKAGIRFLGLGGTSAGSIVALILASIGTPADEKAAEGVKILSSMPMNKFIDGDDDAQDLTNAMLNKSHLFKLLWKGLQCVDNLENDLGLHPGKAFFEWMHKTLSDYGISTLKDLRHIMSTMPEGLVIHQTNENYVPDDLEKRLVIVAADVSTQTKVEFPSMSPMYWENPEETSPAYFARASMSVPFFFSPMEVKVPQLPATKVEWEKLARYTNDLPKKAMFMDGGIMSNFPINAFHKPGCIPRKPTLGAKLGFDREPVKIDSPAKLLSNIFDSARHTLDFDFIVKNPDYSRLVSYIDVEKKHNWLDFNMRDAEKRELFAAGVESAVDFLCGSGDGKVKPFDWAEYKKLRTTLASINKNT